MLYTCRGPDLVISLAEADREASRRTKETMRRRPTSTSTNLGTVEQGEQRQGGQTRERRQGICCDGATGGFCFFPRYRTQPAGQLPAPVGILKRDTKKQAGKLPAALENATLGPAGRPLCATYFCLMGLMRGTQCLTPGSAAVVVGSHRRAR